MELSELCFIRTPFILYSFKGRFKTYLIYFTFINMLQSTKIWVSHLEQKA